MKFTKPLLMLFFVILSSSFFTGCLPSLYPMGSESTLIHKPRLNKNSETEKAISVSAFGGMVSKSPTNVEHVLDGGANLDFNLRSPGGVPWLFINTGVTNAYGKLNIACNDSDCKSMKESSKKNAIFRKYENQSYSFGSVQEYLRLGVEGHPGILVLGLSGGIQLFQDFGDFETARQELIKEEIFKGPKSKALGQEYKTWIGLNVLDKGIINLEVSLLIYDGVTSSGLSLGYFHNNGLYTAVNLSTTAQLHIGKSFVF